MSVTISEEEYQYLQRCRATAEFLGKYVESRTLRIDSGGYPFGAYPVIEFEFRGVAPLIPREKAPNSPTAADETKALDLDYLNNPPASRKLLKGE